MSAMPAMSERARTIGRHRVGLIRVNPAGGRGHCNADDRSHILARAGDLASSTDRTKVRDALEQVRNDGGRVRQFDRPFTPERDDALQRSDLFFARFRADGASTPSQRVGTKTARAATRA
jgi:hypothetical protein